GSAEQTGSLGVVTLNCARLGHVHAGDEAGLYREVDRLMGLARDSLEAKRRVVQQGIDTGLFPYTKRYLGSLDAHFSTIGVNGVNEMIRNFTASPRHPAGEHDITTPAGHAMAVRLLDHVRERIATYQEETGNMYNLEATPRRRDDLPVREGGPRPVPRYPAGGNGIEPVLHELHPTARRLHRRPVRGARAPGGTADEIHRRHGVAPLPRRGGLQRRGVQGARAQIAGELARSEERRVGKECRARDSAYA